MYSPPDGVYVSLTLVADSRRCGGTSNTSVSETARSSMVTLRVLLGLTSPANINPVMQTQNMLKAYRVLSHTKIKTYCHVQDV